MNFAFLITKGANTDTLIDFFQGINGYANASPCYVIRAMPVLFSVLTCMNSCNLECECVVSRLSRVVGKSRIYRGRIPVLGNEFGVSSRTMWASFFPSISPLTQNVGRNIRPPAHLYCPRSVFRMK